MVGRGLRPRRRGGASECRSRIELKEMGEKLKVYLESSFISYLTGRETTDAKIASWQAFSRKWWKEESPKCDLNVSVFVINESRVGSKEQIRLRDEKLEGLTVLETVSPEIVKLAKILMKRHAVPETEATDALHIATAAFHEMDVLLTWNCRHMANPYTLPITRKVIETAGYACPTITTPERFMEDNGK